jgi:Mg-chelatase subunit ChlI
MATGETTAAELVEQGIEPRGAAERLRDAMLDELRRLQDEEGLDRQGALERLFPETVLEDRTLDVLVTSLLSGSNVLVLGPPGSGKTTLAKAVWDVFPKQMFAVADCPVHDDPFSLIDPEYAERVPPCPYCKENHGGASVDRAGSFDATEVDPADVPVREVRLREGYGHARVQGSPEVFPDNLTGSINLARLEEVGDPTSPLVLQPGKILQAHRGLMLVDEIGKLPRGTQNVLLQALQEGIVSPAKSRETFPADVVTVATSNYEDLGNITEPLNDRLANVQTPFPTTAEANRRIITHGLSGPGVGVPGPYHMAAVRIVMQWRDRMDGGRELSEVGSNRTLIDIVQRTASYALAADAARPDPDDLERAARDAMTGRIRARSGDGFEENRLLVERFLEEHGDEAAREGAVTYWCRFFEDELAGDEASGERVVERLREVVDEHGTDAKRLRELADGGDEDVSRFVGYVAEQDGLSTETAAERLPAVWGALEDLGAFEEP